MEEAFPQKLSGGDIARAVSTMAVSVVPILGDLATAIIQQIPAPLAKRQATWFNALAEKVNVLGKTSLTIESIQAGGPVLDAILESVQVALKTSSEEKRQALINCVIKTASADSIGQARLQMVIRRLDQMTEWHLRLLRLADGPPAELARLGKKYAPYMSSSISGLIDAAYPELNGQRDFVERVSMDLYDMGLVGTKGIMTMMSAGGALESRSTSMGKSLVEDCFR